jgi:hypothetical protein
MFSFRPSSTKYLEVISAEVTKDIGIFGYREISTRISVVPRTEVHKPTQTIATIKEMKLTVEKGYCSFVAEISLVHVSQGPTPRDLPNCVIQGCERGTITIHSDIVDTGYIRVDLSALGCFIFDLNHPEDDATADDFMSVYGRVCEDLAKMDDEWKCKFSLNY